MKLTIRHFLIIPVVILLFGMSTLAQKKPAKPAVKSDNPKVTALLKRSGYGHTIFGDNVWTVESGVAAPILVSYVPEEDIILIFMTVAEKGKFRVTADAMADLLKVSGEVLYGKVAWHEDGSIIFRAEWKLKQLDQQTFEVLLVAVLDGYKQATEKMTPILVK